MSEVSNSVRRAIQETILELVRGQSPDGKPRASSAARAPSQRPDLSAARLLDWNYDLDGDMLWA
jgi:hypothetical protein